MNRRRNNDRILLFLVDVTDDAKRALILGDKRWVSKR